jgi:two-component system nitrogen regulation response regulator NtrX
LKTLIIDDEKNICLTIQGILEDEGYEVDYALTFAEGLEKLKSQMYDFVFLDIWLPDRDGIEGLKEIKRYFPELEVVMISGHGNIENAVEAIRLGAWDFLEKPLSLDRIVLIVKHLEDKMMLQRDLREYKFNILKRYDLIGRSAGMVELKKKIEKIAPTNAWVLITGENGTGKEHVARLVHMLSKRDKKSFVEINCAAIPSDLLESEMFGHEKGAYTGAHATTKGKFELANGGTVFLDEIGDMELSAQAKLLRVLESNSFSRVGGNETIESDFRIICATNKNLEEEIKAGNFREDLYYRINVVPFVVPPLRERADDVPFLVDFFVKEACSLNGMNLKQVDGELMSAFMRFEWPGNVRQLKNIVERMVVLADEDRLTVEDAPAFILGGSEKPPVLDVEFSEPLKHAKENFEKYYILNVLRDNAWNISKSAKVLEIERTYLHRKIRHYGLDGHKDGNQ